MMKSNQTIYYYQVTQNEWENHQAEIIIESAVSLTVNGETWLSLMCTPINLEAMALGFLFNERVIESHQEVESVRVCPTGDNVDIWLAHSAQKPKSWMRTSGCTGGVTSIKAEDDFPKIALTNGGALTPKQIQQLVVKLFDSQELYRLSGGVHTSAISDGDKIIVTAEDIGRHNTLDKLAGLCLMDKFDLERRIILTTGRISSEMIQKSARIGASIVVSRTSPSSMSISLAEKWGITLIGYARRNGFRIYAHPERIIQTSPLLVQSQ